MCRGIKPVSAQRRIVIGLFRKARARAPVVTICGGKPRIPLPGDFIFLLIAGSGFGMMLCSLVSIYEVSAKYGKTLISVKKKSEFRERFSQVPKITEQISKVIREEMRGRKWSAQKLADEARFSKGTANKLRSPGNYVSNESLEAAIDALGIEEEKLQGSVAHSMHKPRLGELPMDSEDVFDRLKSLESRMHNVEKALRNFSKKIMPQIVQQVTENVIKAIQEEGATKQ